MTRDLLRLLVCPDCRSELRLDAARLREDQIESGELRCSGCARAFPIVRFVPRFVASDNYSSSFGFQWNRFRRTQLDSSSGQPISQKRFFGQSGWSAGELAGRTVLDVGCGAGRFAEVVRSAGARLVALDYSEAVDACWSNVGAGAGVDVVQADVYRLPFRPGAFEFVYCFGVLQHTPDVHRAFRALTEQVRPGGRLAVDVYPKLAANALWPKYWLRPITRRINSHRLFAAIQMMVRALWPLSLALGRVPVVGRKLRYALPIANYDGVLPLSPEQLREWAVLDTFDMLAPAHDHPQTAQVLRDWFEEAGFTDVETFRRGLVIGRGTRPAASDGIRTDAQTARREA